LCKEVGVSKSAIHHWVKAYQERGEAGLRDPGVFPKKQKKLPVRCARRLLRSRSRNHSWSPKDIPPVEAGVLPKCLPETVRRTLKEESLIVPSQKKHPANITRPRFFERAAPNQMWQGDIFTFRLGEGTPIW